MTIIRNMLINLGVAAAVLTLGTAVVCFASRRSTSLSHVKSWHVLQTHRLATTKPVESSPGTILPSQLTAAIHSSAKYLVRANKDDGRFVYRTNLEPAVTLNTKYNMLRHAGAIYALAKYQKHYPDTQVLTTLVHAAAYLKNASVAEVPEHPEMLAVWSKPDVTGGAGPLQAKLGGAGLALVALLSLEDIRPMSTSIDELRRLGKFIVFMQKRDGGFYSKYIPEDGGRSDKWTSLYYPGEAVLGLLMLYEHDRSAAWLEAAADGLAYLARRRADLVSVEADHWALLATSMFLPLYDGAATRHPREMFVKHGVQICESIFNEQPQFFENDPGLGGFSADGRTCPTATRLEGLVAALAFLPDDKPILREKMVQAIEQGLSFLYRAQLRDGKHAGGMPRAIARLPSSHPLGSRYFNRRATEVRIDYVQHAMCAMLDFQKYSEQIDLHCETELRTR